MSAVSNASPLINLARIGQMELIHQLYGDVIVPEAVWDYLDMLRNIANFRLSDAVYRQVLSDDGEF